MNAYRVRFATVPPYGKEQAPKMKTIFDFPPPFWSYDYLGQTDRSWQWLL